jgi:hypothetical protein
MIKKLGIFAGFIVVGLGIGTAIGWQQATKLPPWYTQAPPPTPDDNVLTVDEFDQPADLQRLQSNLQQILQSQPSLTPPPSNPLSTTVNLNSAEFNEFIVLSASQSPTTQPVIQAVRGIKTEIQNNQVQTEVILAPGELEVEKLPPTAQAPLTRLLEKLPGLQDREIALRLVGQPRVEQGHLILDPDTRIAIGGLSLSVRDWAKRLGLPNDSVNLGLQLNLSDLAIANIHFDQNTAILSGSPPGK